MSLIILSNVVINFYTFFVKEYLHLALLICCVSFVVLRQNKTWDSASTDQPKTSLLRLQNRFISLHRIFVKSRKQFCFGRFSLRNLFEAFLRRKMGTKVNIFSFWCLLYGIAFWNFYMTSLFVILTCFTVLYKYFKVWQFTRKFPGRNFTPDLKTLIEISTANLHCHLDDQWSKYGRDKFVTWIGYKRFVTVSKLSEVKVN